MLEFIVGKYAIENFNKKEGFYRERNRLHDVLYFIISLIIALIAAYLAYECNAGENNATRWFVTVVAFLFSGLYLIYYLIRYIILGNECKDGRMPMGKSRKVKTIR